MKNAAMISLRQDKRSAVARQTWPENYDRNVRKGKK
jgi:hypothetical protein